MLQNFQPGELWLDNNGVHINAHGGGILYHRGIYYWYGEHKIAGEAGNQAQVGVHCYRSRDLYNWEDAGIALEVLDEPTSDITCGCILERPKVIFNPGTGKFVMWFHLELKNVPGYRAARSGVAVGDAPEGPFRYLYSLRPNAGHWPVNVRADEKTVLPGAAFPDGKFHGGPVGDYNQYSLFRRDFAGGQMARDMTLFVDDDGTAYHLYASEENGTLHISQLSDDYLRPAGRYARAFPGRFMEAPAIFKDGGKYYLVASDCTGWNPNPARSAVAEHIFGPWQELGNPWQGAQEQTAISFDSQPTFILPVAAKPGTFIFMADRWRPKNAIDGRYIWQPVQWLQGRPVLPWQDQWNLSSLCPRA